MPIIALSALNHANRTVVAELVEHGFWTDRLNRIEVNLVPFSWGCYGWQCYGGTGDICIPQISMIRLRDLIIRSRGCGLRDVLRHEWAHALADTHRGLFRSRRFSVTFGGSHERGEPCSEWNPECHVTRYAATNPSEDFAEVFALWLKHGGRMPTRFHPFEAVRRRWEFVSDLAGAIKDGARRW